MAGSSEYLTGTGVARGQHETSFDDELVDRILAGLDVT
jgi:hypothetical protein